MADSQIPDPAPWGIFFAAMGALLIIAADPMHPTFYLLAGYGSLVLALVLFVVWAYQTGWFDDDYDVGPRDR